MKYCKACTAMIEIPGARFCPYCGGKALATLDFRKAVAGTEFAVVFKVQETKDFREDYARLRELVPIKEIGVGKSLHAFVASTRKEFLPLYRQITPLIKGQNITFFEDGKIFRAPTQFSENACCYARRIVKEIPEYSCFDIADQQPSYSPNLVGCQHVGLGISFYMDIYRAGYWEDLFGTFRFDKAKIIAKAEKVMRYYRLCPFLDEARVRRFIELWPERINIHQDKRWQIYPPIDDWGKIIVPPDEMDAAEFGEDDGDPDKPEVICTTNALGDHLYDVPVMTDMNFFIDLAKQLYPSEISDGMKAAIYASIDAIQMAVYQTYSK